MRHHLSVELRTERLVLRPFRSDDVAAFEAFARLDDYLRYLGPDHPAPEALVANNLGVDGSWVIELDGRVVGSIFLGEELACLLDPAVHRKGLGVEATAAVIDDGFERLGFEAIVARADPANTASVRGMMSLGFVAEGNDWFRLVRADWRAGST